MKTKYSLGEFIEMKFIPNMQEMINQGFQYYVFPLICQGIEILGSVSEENDLSDFGRSSERFKKGLDLFNGNFYNNNQKDKYEQMRGAFIHQMRPGSPYVITSSVHDGMKKENHLKDDSNGKTIIVIEEFLNDFEKAFTKLKNMVNKGKARPDKFKEPFLSISSFSPSSEFTDSTSMESPPVSGGDYKLIKESLNKKI